MTLDEDLRTRFRGTIHAIHQGEYLAALQRRGIQEADRSGLCWELCRRWIQFELGLTGFEDKYDLFPMNDVEALELIREHEAHNHAGVDANYQVAGTQILGSKRRRYGGIFRLKAKGLKSRDAVIDYMYNDPGLYIYGFYKNGGHAVAFNISERKLDFFDPNFGWFMMHDPANRADFKAWFHQFWGRYYKTEYTRGQRELTKYGDNPIAV